MSCSSTPADSQNGVQFWRSDGTTAGTVVADDFAPGFAGTPMADFLTLGDTILFNGVTDTGDFEMWRTDGTAGGTFLLKEIASSEALSQHQFTGFSQVTAGGLLYFTALDPALGTELFISDGSAEGTRLLREIFPGNAPFGPAPTQLTAFGDRVLFTADDGKNGRELWLSDGTEAGTALLIDLNP